MQQGLPALPEQTRLEIEARARAQAANFELAYQRLKSSPFLDDWPDAEIDGLAAQFADLPCPALDADGSCLIHPFRPLACRTMGIPVETAGVVEGACEVQTSTPLIRLAPSFRGEEHRLAEQEAAGIAALRETHPEAGEEVLLAYGFLPERVLPPPCHGETTPR